MHYAIHCDRTEQYLTRDMTTGTLHLSSDRRSLLSTTDVGYAQAIAARDSRLRVVVIPAPIKETDT